MGPQDLGEAARDVPRAIAKGTLVRWRAWIWRWPRPRRPRRPRRAARTAPPPGRAAPAARPLLERQR
jgi:hypothetical protein